MSPNIWGPPIWTFFHTIAEKINEDRFQEIFPPLFNYIKNICRVLPCPDCSNHATGFLSRINTKLIKTKNDFKNVMFIFHNEVNKRKNKQQFDINLLTNKYENNNLISAYNGFVSVFNKRGNTRLLADSFHRNQLITQFKNWLLINMPAFLPEKPQISL